ncbi:MAG: chloride channel protein [Myxococcales bacterium]|nr:chloride channel protein [Myxococcales bacterium]MCB9736374.1 chloride channel protein [Deltaproteobacteria bacterium]
MKVNRPNLPSWMDVVEARRIGRRLAIYGALGAAVAVVAAAFSWAVDFVTAEVFEPLTGIALHSTVVSDGAHARLPITTVPSGGQWLVLVLPAAGGLLAGLLIAYWSQEAAGGGVSTVIESYHRGGGRLRERVPFARFLASTITMGTGGSAGNEGPVAQIGAGVGSLLAGRLKLDAQERRILMMTGLAAGLGAAFHAPLAGALFAAEVLYSEMEFEQQVLVPAVLTSTIGYGVYGIITGWSPEVAFPPAEFKSMVELLPYTVLALAVSMGVHLFIRTNDVVRNVLGKNRHLPLWLRPAVGGLFVGAIGLFVPALLGKGVGLAQAAIDGGIGIGALLLLAVGKMVTTALTTGSGGSGGTLWPSLVIGGAIGGAVGQATVALFPSLGVNPAAFVLVGMAGFFAAASNITISTVFLVCEIAGTYRLLVPAIWVCALAWMLARRASLFTSQVPTRLDAPPQVSEVMAAVLRRIRVRDAMPHRDQPLVAVNPNTPLRDLLGHFARSEQSVFPIVSSDGRLVGVVDGRDLRRRIGEHDGINNLLIAEDFLSPAVTIAAEATLYDAIARMSASGYTEDLLVIDDDEHRRLLGSLSRRHIITTYYQRALGETDDALAIAGVAPPPADDDVGALLAGALRRGGVVYGLRARDRDATLRALVDRAPWGTAVDPNQIATALIRREGLSSTALGEGIAIPHPPPGAIGLPREPVVVLSTLKRPVAWGAPDERPVETLALLLCTDHKQHLELLAALVRALRNDDVKAALKVGADLDELVQTVRRALPRPVEPARAKLLTRPVLSRFDD